jgi:hypothetical protein
MPVLGLKDADGPSSLIYILPADRQKFTPAHPGFDGEGDQRAKIEVARFV